jgi:hypothetical protein
MRFEELTEDDKLKIEEIYTNREISWDTKERLLSEYTGVASRTARSWAAKLGYTNPIEPSSPQYEEAKKNKINKKAKRFIITWAQNNTPVHEPFLKNIEAYAKFIDAEICIIAGRYKNPTSVFSDKDYDTWHSRTIPYLYANRESIHKRLVVIGDVKVSPTAVTPMTGMKGFSGSESCIFGHPKAQEETLDVLEGRPEKKMMTTGACTIPNYTDSKAGKKGEFHHTLGFVIVEIKDKKKVFTRCVTATDNGNFYDLYYKVEFKGGHKKINMIDGLDFVSRDFEGKSEVEKIKEIDGIVLGDMHFGEHDEQVVDVTLNVLMKKLKPKKVVLHDVFDGKSISHHDRKDHFAQYFKALEGTNNLKQEIDNMIAGLKPFAKYDTIIVRSNHDDFLDRWLRDVDIRKERNPLNYPAYSEFSTLVYERKAVNGVIPYIINQEYPNMTTLGLNDSYRIHDWEVGQHGHIGSGGSRGSINQYRQLNTKMIVGHSHAPSRKDGVIQVGTSTKLRLGYNSGASKWGHAHAIIHPNGKGQLIYFNKGEFTTFE